MKQIIKYIILVSLMLIGVNASSVKWAPIMMGDITTFVPYTDTVVVPPPQIDKIKTNQSTYNTDEIVTVTINTPLSGDQDWVGIYPVGSNNDWNNVIAWNWVGQGTTSLSKIEKLMPAGEYEIRLFFKNSYNVEATNTFSVQGTNNNNYVYPPETAFNNLPTNNNVPKPETAGLSVKDLEFNATITRITDATTICAGIAYPKTQSWNADMSLLKVSHKLYDATTLEESPITQGLNCDQGYAKLGTPHGSAFRWSHKNPKLFYSLKHNQSIPGNFIFQKYTIQDDNTVGSELIKDFSRDGFEEMMLSEGEGNMDYDEKLVIFKAKKYDNDHVFAVLLDTITKSVKEKEMPNTSWGKVYVEEEEYSRSLYDWITISPKGNYILENKTLNGDSYINGERLEEAPETGIFRYDLNFENPQRVTNRTGHGDIGIDKDGNQVWVQFEYANRSGTWSYNLDTLEDGKKLLKNNYGHISCQNYNRPGWCYLSTTLEGIREVYALKLDESQKVNRFAQTRHNADLPGDPSSYGSPSPDGKRIIFQSNWGQNGNPDVYHTGLKMEDSGL